MDDIIERIIRTGRVRYYLNRISNLEVFDPVFNALAPRTPVGFRRLVKMGLTPSIVVDVGANEGQWTLEHLPVFPQAKFLMVEAQPGLRSYLERVDLRSNGRARHVIAMLGPEIAEAEPFYLTGTGSSRFEEMTSFKREVTTLPMTTLDAVLGNLGGESVLLKMDVQGGELEVLSGASNSLQHIEVIFMEASIVQYNAGAPRFAEIVSEMDRLGFRLFDIWDLRRIRNVLGQCDVVFVRKDGHFEKVAQETVKNYGRQN